MTLIGIVPSGTDGKKDIINQDYLEAVLRAGGTPVFFPVTASREQISELLDQTDGLLLTGGEDVDPALYGEEKLRCCGTVSPDRDAMELPLCLEALRRRMPVLAICRGLQVLSCALGGTLYQDLAEQYGEELRHPRYDTPGDPVHPVEVRPGTLLASITGAGSLAVNSRHHQAVRQPGKGLRICAVAPDGVIEGAEMPEYPFVLGVQWHPESLSDRCPEHQKLFDMFVRAGADYSRRKPAAGAHRDERTEETGKVKEDGEDTEMNRAGLLKKAYGMEAHFEGGWFAEAFSSAAPPNERAGAGSIYFLLDRRDISHFHQLDCDEIWYYHEGCGVRLIVLEDGKITEPLLGRETEKGQRAAVFVPRGAVFAAFNLDPESYTLLSAVTSPAFTYEGFRLILQDELARMDPECARKYGYLAFRELP